jgi:hypothetical protein
LGFFSDTFGYPLALVLQRRAFSVAGFFAALPVRVRPAGEVLPPFCFHLVTVLVAGLRLAALVAGFAVPVGIRDQSYLGGVWKNMHAR